MVAGRSTEPRSATVTTTSTSTAITAPAGTFAAGDAGRAIVGTGIPANAILGAVASDTAATLSAAATASGSPTATIGAATPAGTLAAGVAYGFLGWSPESDAEAKTYSIVGGASATSPGRVVNAVTPLTHRTRG